MRKIMQIVHKRKKDKWKIEEEVRKNEDANK